MKNTTCFSRLISKSLNTELTVKREDFISFFQIPEFDFVRENDDFYVESNDESEEKPEEKKETGNEEEEKETGKEEEKKETGNEKERKGTGNEEERKENRLKEHLSNNCVVA